MSSPARTGDPHLELSNNLAERCVKPFVVARKVFQKSGSEAGVRHTVRLFSIIRKVVINGLDPYRYLEYALENVGKKPIEAILPYSKDLESANFHQNGIRPPGPKRALLNAGC